MKHLFSRTALSVVLAALVLSFSGCYIDGINCIEGNGNPMAETRSLESFNELVSNGSYDIRILPSTISEVRIEAESNLIGYISTFVAGNRLIVETVPNRCISHNLPVRITVYTPFVDAFELNGSGSIQAYGLNTEELYAWVNGSGSIDLDATTDFFKGSISGSGSIEITGLAETTDMQLSGSGTIFAYGLDQNKCYATISGSGNMYVYPNQLLDARITGSGTIYYKGNPTVNKQITGSGKIIRQ
jgi:hypothetical protein